MSEIKFQRLDTNNKKKWIAIGIIVLLVIAIIFYIIKRTYSIGTDDAMINKMVDGLSFENIELNCVDGVTTLNVEVYNETGSTYALKSIGIKVITEDNEELDLLGYIGNELAADEGRMMSVRVDHDITNAKSIVYTVNK